MRIDVYLTENGYFGSRAKSFDAIKNGLVFVNGEVVTKASKNIKDGDEVSITGALKFVSKGGYKLDKALEEFNLSVSDKIFADIGASTGGFTDCLLSRGVRKVYAVDVGENQLAPKIACNPKVVVMDNTNARYLSVDSFKDSLDGIVVDCSFISLKLLVGVFGDLLGKDGVLLALIKPQFECGAKSLSKNGILKDAKIRERVVLEVISAAKQAEFFPLDMSKAPNSKDKNVEYVIYFSKCGKPMSLQSIQSFLRR